MVLSERLMQHRTKCSRARQLKSKVDKSGFVSHLIGHNNDNCSSISDTTDLFHPIHNGTSVVFTSDFEILHPSDSINGDLGPSDGTAGSQAMHSIGSDEAGGAMPQSK